MPAGLGPRLRLVALGLTVTVLIALIALASRSSFVPSAEGRAHAGPVIAIIHLLEILGIAVELLVVLLLLVLFRLSRSREDDEDQTYHEPVRVHWVVRLLILAFPLLVWGGLIFALTRLHPSGQQLEPAPIAGAPSLPGRDGFVEQVGASLGLAWWEILIAVALAGLAFVAIIRVLRVPSPVPREEPALTQHARALSRAIAAGQRDARLEPDPRRAVIAAYAAMEHMLAAQGLPRRDVEAPLEYMNRLFGALNVSGDALRTLTDLFELARFSHHAIAPATKERAIAALVVIEQELQVAR